MKKLYPLCFFFLPFLSLAQDLVVKGLVTVQPDALLHVEGNVDIHNTGTMDIQASGSQHGLVRVNVPVALSPGTWNCDGATTGEGNVEFRGIDVDYTVSGNNVSFPNLILDFGDDFPLSGQLLNAVTLEDDATITETLHFESGKIVTDANILTIANTNPAAITGDFGTEGSRFVQGTLRWQVDSLSLDSNSFYFFPVGVQPDYSLPVRKRGYNPISIDLRDIQWNEDGQMPDSVYSVMARFVEQNDIGNVGLQYTTSGDCYFTSAQQYLEFYGMVRGFGYWDVKPDDTTRSTGWNYDFVCYPDVPYLLAQNPGMTHLKVFKAPSTAAVPSSSFDWSPYFFESGNPCNGVNVEEDTLVWFPGPFLREETDRIEAWDLQSFSRFGLGGGTGAGLPIELLYLEAKAVNNKYIKVDWVTATETNNAGFEILRSTDGVNFTQVGEFVPSKAAPNGNSTEELAYYYDDSDVVPNQLYYYRLRQVDLDGSSELTRIVFAMITESVTFEISEFIPNPSENDSKIQVTSSTEKMLNIKVYNTLGQVLMGRDYRVIPGVSMIDFNFSHLADGTYYAIIKADNEYYNRKLILTK